MADPTSPRILLQAAGIHTGGGRVLLDEILAAAGRRVSSAALDSRYIENSPWLAGAEWHDTRFLAIKQTVPDRIRALRILAQQARAGDILLHFNSLPPLVRSAAHTIVFLHARYLVTSLQEVSYPPVKTARHIFERLLLRLGAAHVDEFWVQTQSMQLALKARYPKSRVRVVPLVDQKLAAMLDHPDRHPSSRIANSFFYPADGMRPKNHAMLLRAWQLLADEGVDATLQLTLETKEFEAAVAEAVLTDATIAKINNLGKLTRDEVLRQLARTGALIFPSLSESFGLPMLEASAVGTPILASEMDHVRDVCAPAESFDPQSPRSIARAVRRFLNVSELPTRPITGSGFVEMLDR